MAQIKDLCSRAKEVLSTESNMHTMPAPVTVVGCGFCNGFQVSIGSDGGSGEVGASLTAKGSPPEAAGIP